MMFNKPSVDDNVKILICPVFLQKHAPEYILKDTHHGHPVDVLQFLKFGKCLYQIKILHCSTVESIKCNYCFCCFCLPFARCYKNAGGRLV